MVSAERALRDFALTASRRRLERAVDQAVVDRRTSPPRFRQSIDDAGGYAGAAALRSIVDTAQRYVTLTRSELEEACWR